jgi:hypothetical protein
MNLFKVLRPGSLALARSTRRGCSSSELLWRLRKGLKRKSSLGRPKNPRLAWPGAQKTRLMFSRAGDCGHMSTEMKIPAGELGPSIAEAGSKRETIPEKPGRSLGNEARTTKPLAGVWMDCLLQIANCRLVGVSATRRYPRFEFRVSSFGK